jgi:hypothetical protein
MEGLFNMKVLVDTEDIGLWLVDTFRVYIDKRAALEGVESMTESIFNENTVKHAIGAAEEEFAKFEVKDWVSK